MISQKPLKNAHVRPKSIETGKTNVYFTVHDFELPGNSPMHDTWNAASGLPCVVFDTLVVLAAEDVTIIYNHKCRD